MRFTISNLLTNVIFAIFAEIAHGFTNKASDLIYGGESGGMNEGILFIYKITFQIRQ